MSCTIESCHTASDFSGLSPDILRAISNSLWSSLSRETSNVQFELLTTLSDLLNRAQLFILCTLLLIIPKKSLG